ncbi:MAG: ABC transporter substrate-binding protein, partial [Clostridiales bacterium]|nr:ABC transporter substrate-binding protein [Clostridiales bacterium]
MKHLKVTALLAAALMAVGSMTACGGVNSPDSGSTADKGNSSGDVTLSFLRAGTSEDAQIAYQAIIDEYTKANPNVKIE